MLVTPCEGRKGDPVCWVDGALCLFDRRGIRPTVGAEVEVMISHHLPLKYDERRPEGSRQYVSALIVRPVTDDDLLIEHKGFECSGSMCRTTASVEERSDRLLMAKFGRTLGWLTPGRTPVIEVSNINARFDGRKERPPIPGRAYVTRADVLEHQQRICGVPALEDLHPGFLRMIARDPRRRPAAA